METPIPGPRSLRNGNCSVRAGIGQSAFEALSACDWYFVTGAMQPTLEFPYGPLSDTTQRVASAGLADPTLSRTSAALRPRCRSKQCKLIDYADYRATRGHSQWAGKRCRLVRMNVAAFIGKAVHIDNNANPYHFPPTSI
jgi:hypothetical protein